MNVEHEENRNAGIENGDRGALGYRIIVIKVISERTYVSLIPE